MTVFGAHRFVPSTIVAEKVLESALRWIECVLQERQIPKSGVFGSWICPFILIVVQLPVTQLTQQDGKNKSTCIVVCGVSLPAVRDRKDRVLEYPSVIGHPIQMIQFQFRQLIQ